MTRKQKQKDEKHENPKKMLIDSQVDSLSSSAKSVKFNQTKAESLAEKLDETCLVVDLGERRLKGNYHITAHSVTSSFQTETTTSTFPATISGIIPGDEYFIRIFHFEDENKHSLIAESHIKTSKTIGYDGGTLTLECCKLEFPRGVLTSDTKVRVSLPTTVPEVPEDCLEIASCLDFDAEEKELQGAVHCLVPTYCRPSQLNNETVVVISADGQPYPASISKEGLLKFECTHFSPKAFLTHNCKKVLGIEFGFYMMVFHNKIHKNFHCCIYAKDTAVDGKIIQEMKDTRQKSSIKKTFYAKLGDKIRIALKKNGATDAIGETEFHVTERAIREKQCEFIFPHCTTNCEEMLNLKAENITCKDRKTGIDYTFNYNYSAENTDLERSVTTACNVIQGGEVTIKQENTRNEVHG